MLLPSSCGTETRVKGKKKRPHAETGKSRDLPRLCSRRPRQGCLSSPAWAGVASHPRNTALGAVCVKPWRDGVLITVTLSLTLWSSAGPARGADSWRREARFIISGVRALLVRDVSPGILPRFFRKAAGWTCVTRVMSGAEQDGSFLFRAFSLTWFVSSRCRRAQGGRVPSQSYSVRKEFF